MEFDFSQFPKIYNSPNLDLKQIACLCSLSSILYLQRLIDTTMHQTEDFLTFAFKAFYLFCIESTCDVQTPEVSDFYVDFSDYGLVLTLTRGRYSVIQGLLNHTCHFTRLSMKRLINLVMEQLLLHLIALQNTTGLD